VEQHVAAAHDDECLAVDLRGSRLAVRVVVRGDRFRISGVRIGSRRLCWRCGFSGGSGAGGPAGERESGDGYDQRPHGSSSGRFVVANLGPKTGTRQGASVLLTARVSSPRNAAPNG